MDTLQPQTPRTVPVGQAESPKKPMMWIVATIVLALVCILLAVLLFMSKNDDRQKQLNTARTQVATLQKENGELKKTITQAAAAATAGVRPSVDTSKTSDTDAIIALAKAWVHAENGGENKVPNVSVEKIENGFARAAVSAEKTGYSCIYKKSDNAWLKLYCAQGDSSETTQIRSQYSVPESILK